MSDQLKGSLTVFLALCVPVFLSLCLVLVEGARVSCIRVQAAQTMELAEFSVLSEYQQELLEYYDLFFLELDYEQGKEQRPLLEQRARKYLELNGRELETVTAAAQNFRRATDGKGSVFFEQAVKYMKQKSGYGFFEELLGKSEFSDSEASENIGDLLEENMQQAEELLQEEAETQGSAFADISLPGITFPSLEVLTEAVFGDLEGLSEKSVNLEESIGKRELQAGVGEEEKAGIAELQLFHGYLFEHFAHYGSENEAVLTERLEYQLEYIISGKESDKENLEDLMWRIFLLRAGGNYLFYHQDAGKKAAAAAEALAVAGVSGNPALIKIVEEILLLTWAIEDGIQETRRIFLGERVPFYENGICSNLELGYEEYLFLFLNTTKREEKICRAMDVTELEIREQSGYEGFRMDHCTDGFEFQWTYQYHSLFRIIPGLGTNIYEETITGKFAYEI